MKIRLFLITVAIFLLGMTGANLFIGIQIRIAQENLKASQNEFNRLKALSEDLVISSQWATRFSRAYVDTKDPQRRAWYDDVNKIVEGVVSRPENYNLEYWDLYVSGLLKAPENKNGETLSLEDRFMRYNVTTEAISLLKDARNIYSKLVVIERIAMNATDGTFDDGTGTFLRKGKPDSIMAHKILLSEDYTKLNGELSLTVAKLISNIERRYALRIKTEEGVAEHLLAINS